MNIDHGTAGNQCKMCNGRVPKTVFKAGVYTKVAPRTVSNNKPKFMKSFCKPCWKRESFSRLANQQIGPLDDDDGDEVRALRVFQSRTLVVLVR